QLSTEAFKNKTQETAYIFFVGKQDKYEPHVFHCVYSQFAHPYFGETPRFLPNFWGTFKLENEITVRNPEVDGKNVDFESRVTEPEPEPEVELVEPTVVTNKAQTQQPMRIPAKRLIKRKGIFERLKDFLGI
ncbi:hypothetical protein CAG66_10030, partial [Vibrio sp. V40_P2S30T141]|nr:hypothetical protein [Vibrio sp. V40_P2S30T141]